MAEPSLPMQAAIEAARSARGRTSPNPWVGAVVVRDGRIVSSGATSAYGGPHAEAAALAGIDARGADLYTTLEPCMPFEGKRTRPCAEVIAEAGLRRVIVGLQDPHPPVRGQGVGFLRANGIEVETGDGAAAIESLLRPYLKFRSTGRPYVIAKFAVSLDGKVGAPSAGIRWLTGEPARARAHDDRAWVDAIMVGSGTVVSDDPELTARPGGVLAARQPLRVVLDGHGRVPLDARALGPGALVATGSAAAGRLAALAQTGATTVQLEAGDRGLELHQLLAVLGQRNVLSLIAEGGPTVLASLFEGGLVDEVHAYVAPIIVGDAGLPLFPAGTSFSPDLLRETVIEPLHPDVLIRGYTGRWSPS